MDKKAELVGVGGWLAFLVFVFILVGPLTSIASVYVELASAVNIYPEISITAEWRSYKSLIWFIVLVTSLISITAGLLLVFKRESTSVSFAIFALWIKGPASIVFGILTLQVIYGSRVGNLVSEEVIGQLIASIIGAMIWTVYLEKSVRVKNTYYKSSKFDQSHIVNSSLETEKIPEPRGWRSRSKKFRLWIFTSVSWILIACLYTLIFEPYGTMYDDDYIHLVVVAVLPTQLFWGLIYVYDNWIK